MEGKTVIMTVLLLSLLGQIQGERVICCPTTSAISMFIKCFMEVEKLFVLELCASISECKIVSANDCPIAWNKDILKNTGNSTQGDNVVNEDCKLGCASSMYGAITTLQNSDASEVVNGAIEKCTKACSALCTKGSITAVKTA